MPPPEIDNTARSLRLWRWVSSVSGFLLWLCIAFWLLALVIFSVVHALILPRIDVLRPSIERQASEALGLQVHIDTLDADTSGIWPALHLQGVSALDPHAKPVLSINSAWVSLSWASVLRRSLDHLDVEGLHLNARLDEQGQWWVGDIRIGAGTQSAVSDTFFKIHSFTSHNTQITWIDDFHHHESGLMEGLSLDIQNGLLSHNFTLDTNMPNSPGTPLSVRAQMHQPLLSLHPGEWSQWSGQVYAQAQNVELSTLLKYLSPSASTLGVAGTGWLRFWSEVNLGSPTTQVLDVSLSNVKSQPLAQLSAPSSAQKAGLVLDSVHGRLRSKPWKTGREWETESLEVEVAGQPKAWDLSHLRLRLTDPEHPWSGGAQGEINIGQVFLDNVAPMAEKLAPQHPLTPILWGLNLKGELKDFSAAWSSSKPATPPTLKMGDLLNGAKQLLSASTPADVSEKQSPPPLVSSPPVATSPTEASNPFKEITQFRIQGHLQEFSREDRPDAKALPQTLLTPNGKGRANPFNPLTPPAHGASTLALVNATKPWLSNLPNIKGANIAFDVSDHQGHANVAVTDGFADFLGALEEPRVEMKKFLADVAWENTADQLHLHVNNGLIENTDGAGQFKLDWKRTGHRPTSTPSTTPGTPATPSTLTSSDLGLLDLDAQVHHLDAKSLYKYLPQTINAPVRQYLKDALTQGFASQGLIKIRGPLAALPYKNPREGELSIKATLNHVGLNYLPKSVSKPVREATLGTPSLPASASPALVPTNTLSSDWPSLMDIQGEFNITGPSLSISKASTYMAPETRLFWPRVEVRIADLLSPNLEVVAESRSALPDFLSVVNRSAISSLLSHSLQKANARGQAELKLKLNLPLLQIERSKVQGTLTLMNNDLQITPTTPVLSRARGSIAFTEGSMSLQNVQVRALGGDARIEGGFIGQGIGLAATSSPALGNASSNAPANAPANASASTPASPPPLPTSGSNGVAKDSGNAVSPPNANPEVLQLRVNGQFNAEGLAQACELGWISRLGALSQGSAAYSAVIVVRAQSGVEVSLSSTLQGLALSGPGPLRKSASSSIPLSFESVPYKLTTNTTTLNLERMSLVLDDMLLMRLFLDTSTASPRIYKGALSLKSTDPSRGLAPNTPSSPQANALTPASWLRQVTPPTRAIPMGWDLEVDAAQLSLDEWQSALSHLSTTSNDACQDWPNAIGVDKANAALGKEIDLASDILPARMNLSAQTLTVQGRSFHQTHLSTTRRGEHWLAQIDSQEMRGSLDLVLSSDLAKRGLNAHLTYLNITPSAPMSSDPLLHQNTSLMSWLTLSVDQLELKGHALGKLQFSTRASPGPLGQTVWQFDPLTLSNSDAILTASGHWGPERNNPNNSPQTALNLELDIANAGTVLDRFGMPGVLKGGTGRLKAQVSWGGSLINPNFDQLNGQLNLDVERGQFLKTDPGASRLLGVLNLQALPRRLTLDFRDLFGEGFAFDNVRGDLSVIHGNATTHNLVMKGVSAAVMLEGQANISQETQDVRVVVIPEINAGTASLIYSTINPVVGLTSFLAQYVLRQPLIKASTRTFHISGSWQDPQVTKLEPPQETPP